MCEFRYLHIFTLLSDISYGNRTIMVRLCISLYHFKMKPHERLSYGLVCNLLFGPALSTGIPDRLDVMDFFSVSSQKCWIFIFFTDAGKIPYHFNPLTPISNYMYHLL
jgi:hypothetical protein